MIEVLVAAMLALIVAIATYDFLDSSNRSYVRESDLATAQNCGRAALELFTTDIRDAVWSPLGTPFWGVAAGDGTRVRLLADLDGDGNVTAAGEADENLTYLFQGPDGEGLYRLLRGVDLDGDGSFDGPGESASPIATQILPIDFDGDGIVEPFLAYDVEPPDPAWAYDPEVPCTRRVTITFGVRSQHRDVTRKDRPVVSFQSDVVLRNRTL